MKKNIDYYFFNNGEESGRILSIEPIAVVHYECNENDSRVDVFPSLESVNKHFNITVDKAAPDGKIEVIDFRGEVLDEDDILSSCIFGLIKISTLDNGQWDLILRDPDDSWWIKISKEGELIESSQNINLPIFDLDSYSELLHIVMKMGYFNTWINLSYKIRRIYSSAEDILSDENLEDLVNWVKGGMAMGISISDMAAVVCAYQYEATSFPLPGYVCCAEGQEYVRILGDDMHSAISKYSDPELFRDGRSETRFIHVTAREEAISEDGDIIVTDSISKCVAIHPEEPECKGSHVWERPSHLVGGLDENPGFFSTPDGVVCAEVCSRCGLYRSITAPHSYEFDNMEVISIKYDIPNEESLNWIESIGVKDDD